jgi:hypothetical protein
MSYHPHATHESKPVYQGQNDPTLAIFATLEAKPDQNARKNTLQTLTIICLCQARQRKVTFNSFNLVHWHHIEVMFTMAAAAAPRASFSTLYGDGSYWELPTPDCTPLSEHFGAGSAANAAGWLALWCGHPQW